jgi:tetratricopeptide (TPR) repeat protein
VSEIHAAAEWARKQIGLDSLGYEEARNIAKTFRDCGKPEEAIENFKLASSLQSDNWLSQWGLAAVYENQRKWTLAIDTLEGVKKAIESGEAKEDDPKSMLPELLRELGSLNEEAGNHEKALEIYETLLRDYPHDYQSMVGLVTLLRRRGDFVRLLEFLEDLKKTKDERTGLDRRTQAFHELFYDIRYHAAIAAAGANLKTFDVVKDGYQTAIDAAEAKLKSGNGGLGQKERAYITGVISLLLFYFALFCYETHINEDEKQLAVSLWERILQTEEAEKNPDSSLSLAKYFANKKLANVYLEQALLAGPNLEAAAPYVDNLTQLSVIKENEHIGNWSTHQYPKQLLTRYYALTGQKDKAKDTLRAQVKKDLDLLCDEDPSNDYLGYLGLATDLMYAVQDDDVLAAWSLITPDEPETGDQQVETQADVGSIARGAEDKVLSAESNAQNGLPVAKELPPQEQNVSDAKSTTSPGSTIDTAKKLKGPISNYCDGQCGTIWTYANDIYVCKICEDVQFDEHCLKKVRAGTLERRICSKNHEMLHVPKYDEQELKTIGEGNVKVGQKIMTVEDWIQGIRNDWGIPG